MTFYEFLWNFLRNFFLNFRLNFYELLIFSQLKSKKYLKSAPVPNWVQVPIKITSFFLVEIELIDMAKNAFWKLRKSIFYKIYFRKTFWGLRLHDIGLIKVDNFTFPPESVLVPCSNLADYCTVLGTCGTGLTERNNQSSYTKTLKVQFLLNQYFFEIFHEFRLH